MRILAATNNAHKLTELRAILAPHGITVLGLHEAGVTLEVEEDGETFAANAIKKAHAGAAAAGLPVLADDSGLEVAALGGAPGVRSARYAGGGAGGAGDAANLRKLLTEMRDVADRRARFVCVIAVAAPGGRLLGTAEGEVRGQLCRAPRGHGGFGYDPAFIPDGFAETFAELPAATKNRLSHRANALRAALAAGLFATLPRG
ncbi:MAG: RdgB/HAM1 family non-canonical purine NTP pyrophosphatase [Lentisphaeria bacterium]|jgi:XTP/dITP diphosphohydrolase